MIRHINDVLDMSFNEYSRRFPAFFYTDANGARTKPTLIPAQAIAGDRNCPMYFKRLIDVGTMAGDPYYLLFKANPLMGDASREKAVEFFDDFFYEKLKCPSSLDAMSGMRPTPEYPLNGTMTREQAVNAEVLPAADDRQYQEFYDEQMDLVDAQAEDDDFERKHGFRRDDPSIIDVAEPAAPTSSTAIGAAASTAVGMPKAIWYGVDLHIPSSGTRLGYDRGSHNLGIRRPRRSLRENLGAAQDRILKLCASGDLKWEDVAKAFVEKASEQQARDVAAESGWFQMDESERFEDILMEALCEDDDHKEDAAKIDAEAKKDAESLDSPEGVRKFLDQNKDKIEQAKKQLKPETAKKIDQITAFLEAVADGKTGTDVNEGLGSILGGIAKGAGRLLKVGGKTLWVAVKLAARVLLILVGLAADGGRIAGWGLTALVKFIDKVLAAISKFSGAAADAKALKEGEMNEKHVEGIDNVIDALDKVEKTNEGEEFDPQNLDKEIAEAGRAAEEIDSEEFDPLDESVEADVGEWNRILGSIR